jgi:hypothetical protein
MKTLEIGSIRSSDLYLNNHLIVKNALLICGLLAPLIYVGSDILAGLSWAGYSFASQAVSELRGIGAPTRTFLIPILFVYAILEILFGLGIWKVVGPKKVLRTIGALLIGLGMLDLMGPLFAMNINEAVGSVTNITHIMVTILTLIILLLMVGLGSFTEGKWFHLYSIITLLTIITFGTLTFLQVPKLAANQSAPWFGIYERINIYSYMLWLGVLALKLSKVAKRNF